MDLSLQFDTCVKSVVSYNKVINPLNENISSKVLKKKSLFATKVYSIVHKIDKLYQLLLDTREAYLNFFNCLPNKACLSNIDLDEIDSIAQTIIGTCSKLVHELKNEILVLNVSQQYKEHNEIILLFIQNSLKKICKIYFEQKALRVKKNIEMRKVSQLEPVKKKQEVLIINSQFKLDIKSSSEIKDKTRSLKIQEINGDISGITSCEDEQLCAEDVQVFETENELLYNELNMLTEEIKQIENKVVQITELQDIFAEKILDQDKNLEQIFMTVVGSTENVKEANEQIRKAIQRNAGLRVWILFFLLVMSFTLIFLDWYNP